MMIIAIARGRRRVAALVTSAIAAACGGHAVAGGLAVYELGTAEVGLASAGAAARAQDASTILWNPAGMTRLGGTATLVGAQLIRGNVGFSPGETSPVTTASGGDGGDPVGWMPGGSAFVSRSLGRGLWAGFGVAGNFGGAARYDHDWIGRYHVQESALLGLSLLPSVAWRVNERLSVGATLNAMYGILKNTVAVNNVAPGVADGQLKLDDSRWGVGVNVGALYEIDSATRIGVTYNSKMDLRFRAAAQFSGLAPGLEAVLAARGLTNATIGLGIRVPQAIRASAYHEVNDRWAVLGSLGWQQWSRFGQVSVGVESGNPTTLTVDQHFKDTWHAALGAQYHGDGNRTYSVGVAYDSAFQNGSAVSPSLPANDQWRIGAGVQVRPRKDFGWGVSAAYIRGGTLGVSRRSALPVATGGRGDLVGAYDDPGVLVMSVHWTWSYD